MIEAHIIVKEILDQRQELIRQFGHYHHYYPTTVLLDEEVYIGLDDDYYPFYDPRHTTIRQRIMGIHGIESIECVETFNPSGIKVI